MFGAIDFRGLAENGDAAIAHQDIDGMTQRRIGGNARIAIGATPLQSSISSEASTVSRRARVAAGSISFMRSIPYSMIFRVLPLS